MTKRRLLGIIMIAVGLVLGVYVGLGLLVVKPVLSLLQVFVYQDYKRIVINILKICILFPMLMTFVFPLLEMGREFLLDNN